jgi:hypothetical protein
VYYEIVHVIIIVHIISSVKVGLNTKLIQSGSNLFLILFMIPNIQILYSTYHKLNGGPCFFIFLLTQAFNIFSCVYKYIIVILKLHFKRTIFFGLFDHIYIRGLKGTWGVMATKQGGSAKEEGSEVVWGNSRQHVARVSERQRQQNNKAMRGNEKQRQFDSLR